MQHEEIVTSHAEMDRGASSHQEDAEPRQKEPRRTPEDRDPRQRPRSDSQSSVGSRSGTIATKDLNITIYVPYNEQNKKIIKKKNNAKTKE